MQNGNYKMKLTSNQLIVMHGTILGASKASRINKAGWLIGDSPIVADMQDKLLLVNLITIAKKVNAKWFMPTKINTITLTPSESIAFWLLFNGKGYSNEYQMAIMLPILNDIHKRFF